jgi:ATP-dependent RNA helicase SUPV3L1/SUV3
VRFGTESIYLEPLLGIEAVRFRALLWAVRHGRAVPRLSGVKRQGRAMPVDPDMPASFYAAIGRRLLDGWALRPDRLERFTAALRGRMRGGRFAADAELAAVAGVPLDELRRLVLALGYRSVIAASEEFFVAKPRRRAAPESLRRHGRPREGHPFAKLKELKFA